MEQKDKNTAPQKTTGTYYDAQTNPIAQVDKLVQDLEKKTGAANYKTSLNALKSVLPALLNDIKKRKGNFNDTARALTSFAVAAIPYGGAALAPLVNFFWPTSAPSTSQLLKQLKNEMIELMDNKIQNYDNAALNAEMQALSNEVAALEATTTAEQFYSSGTPEETARMKANIINTAFNRLLILTSKQDEENKNILKAGELPIYTSVASMHIIFLRYMKKNGRQHAFQFDDATWRKEFVDMIPKKIAEYTKHIQETYRIGVAQINDKLNAMHGIYAHVGQGLDFRWLERKNAEYLRGDDRTKYLKLLDTKKLYIENTIGSSQLKLMHQNPEWKKEGDKYYYINIKGEKQIGWVFDVDTANYKDHYATQNIKIYYLSPEKTEKFEKGEMMTGWVRTNNAGTYFRPDTGTGAWYYLDEEKPANSIIMVE